MTVKQIIEQLKVAERYTSHPSGNRVAANAVITALIKALEVELRNGE